MDYQIIYSSRKTLSLQVKNNLSIVVRAPRRLSKKYIDDFVHQKSDWIEATIKKLESRSINPHSFSKEQIKELKKKTLDIVTPLVLRYATLIGVNPQKISASSAKSRFASCSSRGNLSFSFRLCLYPTEAIEYIVVHELAHMKEMNHSKQFWAVVEKYMPDYKARQQLLKE